MVVGGVLGGAGHDLDVDEAVLLQRSPDGTDTTVHHVGRRDDIGTRSGVGKRLLLPDPVVMSFIT